MIKGQKSVRGGIEDFLCPFTDMYITQGSMTNGSHKGIYANDVRGIQSGVRYPYYAPCTCKCVRVYPESGQAMWQSTNKVRFANGRIDYATFMTVHDNSFDGYVGLVVPQGNQLGNMGTKGNATGVHCHIEVSQSNDTSWTQNQYKVWHFNNEYDLDACYFVDNTNILKGMGGSWKKTSDVPVSSEKYINLPPEYIDERNIYDVNTKQKLSNTLKVRKFGGLSYKILDRIDDFAKIPSVDYGEVLVKITDKTPITDVPTYDHGNY